MDFEGRSIVKRNLFFLLLILCRVDAAEPPKIAVAGGPQALWPQIFQAWAQRHPDIPVIWRSQAAAEAVDLVFAYYPTPAELQDSLQYTAAAKSLAFPEEFVGPVWKREVDQKASAVAAAYLDEGGVENGLRLLEYLYGLVRKDGPPVAPPVKGPATGIYHPDAEGVFPDYASYQKWWREKRASADAKPVGVTFFGTWFRGHDLAAVEAVIRALEADGIMPVAAFGYPLDKVTPLLHHEAVFQPKAVIALNATLSSAKDAEIYQAWGVPVVNGIVTRESAEQWRANSKGLPPDRMAAHLSLPERSGLIVPTLAATTETTPTGMKLTTPSEPGVAAMVNGVKRLLALQNKPNAEKRIALIYYNNPPGKGNVGASYLQVFPSIGNILKRLAAAGYGVPQPGPTDLELRRLIEGNGRNLELWAEGEKARMTGVVCWPVKEYQTYYDRLPAEFRESVEATWGAPADSKLMTDRRAGESCFLLPVLRQNQILLAPQPLRTTFDQASNPDHEKTTPPPHQYIAFYLWLREEWKADAFVHIGRHGTIEWLPGKQTALAPEDAPVLVLGDVPNFNLYVMDGGGEAIQAKRRSAATLISHLTPMIWRAGGRADLEKLHQAFHELVDRGDSLSPALRAEYEKVTRGEVKRLGLDKQLGLHMTASWKEMAPALHRFLHDIEDAPVPAGLPVFGQTPRPAQLQGAVEAYLFAAFPREKHDDVEPKIEHWAEQAVAGEALERGDLGSDLTPMLAKAEKDLPGWIGSLKASGAAEMEGLMGALAGRHVPSRLLGDPLRKPEALPTGGNLHAVDSARIPTEAAWRVGQKMATEFLERYQETHHEPPKRISQVLWYGETERHQGAMESMAMALLGVRPIWNQRGIVEDLQLVSREELGRPRVDVVFTVSGNYRDGFPEKLQMLDRAVRLAAKASDGELAAHDQAIAAKLVETGVDAESAAGMSEIRIFGAKPGAYGVGVQALVERSGGADTAAKIAGLYTSNMGFGYAGNQWGVAAGPALEANLRTVQAVQFSRSSNLYGSLDNDDSYQYVGGLRTAVEQLSKRAPEVYLHNLRKTGSEKMVALREWLAVELHSRHFNPKWINEMKQSGYAGARQISKELEHLYGFQKTAPDHLDAGTWQTVMDVFVKDKYKLELRGFFAAQNPHARQTVLARLLEIDRQGIQKFGAADRQMLLVEYAQSVTKYGAACSAQICGNSALRSHVSSTLRRQGQSAAAASMDASFQKSLRAPPEVSEKPKPKPQPETRLADLRTLGKYAIVWVNRVRTEWRADLIPWWVWIAVGGGYALAILWRARGRKKDAGALTSLFATPANRSPAK